jgi:hypothetical protein
LTRTSTWKPWKEIEKATGQNPGQLRRLYNVGRAAAKAERSSARARAQRGKRRDGTTIWQARWRHPDDAAHRREANFRSKRDASAGWRCRSRASCAATTPIRRGERLVREVADAWRETWTDLEPKTRAGYEAILSKHVLPLRRAQGRGSPRGSTGSASTTSGTRARRSRCRSRRTSTSSRDGSATRTSGRP